IVRPRTAGARVAEQASRRRRGAAVEPDAAFGFGAREGAAPALRSFTRRAGPGAERGKQPADRQRRSVNAELDRVHLNHPGGGSGAGSFGKWQTRGAGASVTPLVTLTPGPEGSKFT